MKLIIILLLSVAALWVICRNNSKAEQLALAYNCCGAESNCSKNHPQAAKTIPPAGIAPKKVVPAVSVSNQ